MACRLRARVEGVEVVGGDILGRLDGLRSLECRLACLGLAGGEEVAEWKLVSRESVWKGQLAYMGSSLSLSGIIRW
jgi:hypothetical protein